MGQHTLQLFSDCQKTEEFLGRPEVPVDAVLEYDGEKKTIIRRFNEFHQPLTHAQELYSDPENGLSEQRAFSALNELVRQKKAKTYSYDGFLWYALCFPRRRA
jgi:hypothetical protein